jgi:hypothetical protein
VIYCQKENHCIIIHLDVIMPEADISDVDS